MTKSLFTLAMAALFAGTPTAASAQEIATLSDADSTTLRQMTDDVISSLQSDGVDAAITTYFPYAASSENGSVREDMRKIDDQCGVMTSIELVKKTNLGSRVARRTFVAVFGGCIVKFEFTFSKLNRNWRYFVFDFSTLNGNRWEF